MTRIALLAISDRGLVNDALASFHLHAHGHQIGEVFYVDDSAHTLGFCGAIREGWARIRRSRSMFDYVFHLEEDFRFREPFSVARMARILEARADVCQVALQRSPINDAEIRAGAVVKQWDFEAHGDWTETPCNFTTNPSLYRRSLVTEHDWPEAPECEGSFSFELAMLGYRSAWLGAPGHVGIDHVATREGVGY